MDKLVDQMPTAKDKLMTLNDEYGAPVERLLTEETMVVQRVTMVLVQVRKNNVDQRLESFEKETPKGRCVL